MIHPRTPPHPALIQPLPTGATPPPTADRLHGAGTPRERQEATTPQRTTPTGIPLMDCPQRPGCHQSPATKNRASPDHGSAGGSEKTTPPQQERGNLARPPQESKQSGTRSIHVLTPQDIPSWTVIRGQDAVRAQPRDDRFAPERGNPSRINIYIYIYMKV